MTHPLFPRGLCAGLGTVLLAWGLAVHAAPSAKAPPAPAAGSAAPAAQAPLAPPLEAGMPLLRTFRPADYGADGQNWALAQGPDGAIYVGNNRGVLHFDGQRWRLTPVANQSAVRSLAVDASGRVYVGAVGEVGYLAPGGDGQLRYVSLLDQLPAEARGFADVWATLVTPEGVVFSSPQRLLRWQEGRFQHWTPAQHFGVAAGSANGTYVIEAGRGLLQLQGDRLTLLPGGERFHNSTRLGLVALPSGDTPHPHLLLHNPDHGFLRYVQGEFVSWSTDVDAALRADGIQGKSLLRLADGRLVVGTLKGGVYLLDAQGRLQARWGKAEGLADASVAASLLDRDGGLWLAQGNGLTRLGVADPLSRLDARHGIDNTVEKLHRHRGQLQLGTSQGAYGLQPGVLPRLQAWAETGQQTHKQTGDFLSVGDTLLAAGAFGVHALQGERRTLILDVYGAKALAAPRDHPGWVVVGVEEGIALLHFDGQRWRDAGRVPGLKDSVRTLVEDAEGRLWAGTYNSGLLRLDLSGLRADGTLGELPVTRYGTEHGLPSLNYNLVFAVGGQPAFATSAGIYRFEPGTNRLAPDPRYAALFATPRTVYVLHDDPANGLWAYTEDPATGLKETGLIRPDAQGVPQWNARPLRALTGQETFSIHADGDGVAWFGVGDGVFRYDGRQARSESPPFATLLSRVTGANGRVLFGGHGNAAALELPYAENALRFEFAAPSFDGEAANRFQVKLEGSDADWSNWSAESYKDVNNLREGRYVFRVRAKNLYDTVGQEASYTFRVLPPWYRTVWAYAAYALLLGLLGWGLLRWRLRRLLAQKAALETTVAERTEALRSANAQLVALDGFKRQMMGMIVHDLKNPLSIILNTLDSPSLMSRLAQLRQSSRQMLNLVLNILDVQKFEDTQVVLDTRPLALAPLAAQAVEQVRLLAERKNLTLTLDVPPSLGVRGDAEMLERVLVNLLTNAVKYTPTNGRIVLSAAPEGTEGHEQVRVAVQDSGEGIPADRLDAVFARFGQHNARDSGQVRSTGLGLSFCQLAVQAHGGQIGVVSEVGNGSTFWFTLPATAPLTAEGLPAEHSTGTGTMTHTTVTDLSTPELDADERARLAPWVAALRPLPIYRYTDLRGVLDRPDFPSSPGIDAWKARLLAAIETENEGLFEALLAEPPQRGRAG
ncbi:sensor histidine kinase [Inhella gelatinilytica]|uniref:histidine kinase n=1 Tax=Inhella gelatinilytica TaxID=2795030 RepID=A0A931NDW5_9BURK|nr:sensor histidine kinase [Inhella gelatinilytica]MBH9552665.1 hypothetical protein [Inhella gelatinilytica]